jgi:cytoskeletal protein RodZ
MVNVDPDDVLQDYYQLTRAHGMPPVVGKVRKPAREISPGPWIVAIVVVLLAALAYWWFVARDTGPNVSVPPPAATTFENDAADSELATSEFDVPEQQSIDEAAVQIEEAVVTEADNSVALEPAVAATTPAPTIAPGELRLSMSFSGECWTEVTDAGGRRLFFDLGRAGRNVSVSGEAPLSVLFGNAENVSVQVNGSDYEILPADRRGRTASFTVLTP